LEDLPIGKWCSFVWWWFTHDADRTEVQKFRNNLWIPPVGAEIPRESPWSAENETAAFASFKAGISKA